MISTNKAVPPAAGEPEKLKVVTTNALKPKEFPATVREYPDVDKRVTKRVGGMITTVGLEEKRQRRSDKRARAAAEIRALKPGPPGSATFKPKVVGSIRVENAGAMPHTDAVLVEPEKKSGGKKKT